MGLLYGIIVFIRLINYYYIIRVVDHLVQDFAQFTSSPFTNIKRTPK